MQSGLPPNFPLPFGGEQEIIRFVRKGCLDYLTNPSSSDDSDDEEFESIDRSDQENDLTDKKQESSMMKRVTNQCDVTWVDEFGETQRCEAENKDRHKKAHQNKYRFACSYCGYSCERNVALSSHLRSSHIKLDTVRRKKGLSVGFSVDTQVGNNVALPTKHSLRDGNRSPKYTRPSSQRDQPSTILVQNSSSPVQNELVIKSEKKDEENKDHTFNSSINVKDKIIVVSDQLDWDKITSSLNFEQLSLGLASFLREREFRSITTKKKLEESKIQLAQLETERQLMLKENEDEETAIKQRRETISVRKRRLLNPS